MKEIFKKGIIIVGIYLVIVAYLLFVSNRIERLEQSDDSTTALVVINYEKSR